uniref:Uncharacterized protein n=1 Tax=Panagrolaimus superbus TaxID=310955 RepID=A0A914ZFN4_9BILA
MTSMTVIICCILLLFTSNISAELFHHRDVRQVGYGYNNNGYNSGYDNNRYDTAGYASNGYSNGYGSNGYNNNQYDQMPMTTTSSSYLKNGLKGAAVGALAAGAYTWWKNGK